MASWYRLKTRSEERVVKGKRNGYFQTHHRRACLPGGWAHRGFLYPAGHLHLVCGINQTPVYTPGLGLRAGLDIALYFNGDCRFFGLEQRFPSPGRKEGLGHFWSPAGLECALVLFIFRAEVSPGRSDWN